MPACFVCHTLLCLFVLTDGQRRPSHRITPSFFAFLLHQTHTLLLHIGHILRRRLRSPLCRMYLPWVSVVRGSSRRSLSLMARRSRRKYVGLTATHGPSSRTNRPNRPTPPPPPRLFPASHTLLLRSTCHPPLSSSALRASLPNTAPSTQSSIDGAVAFWA